MKTTLSILFILLAFSLTAQDLEKTNNQNSEKKLIFFSNNGCGKCEVSQNFFDANHMPYEKLAVKENRPLMYEYVNKIRKDRKSGIGYPVLVYGDSVYFSIKNMNKTLEEIKQMMIEDGTLLKPEKKSE
jgi:hypothetical protein